MWYPFHLQANTTLETCVSNTARHLVSVSDNRLVATSCILTQAATQIWCSCCSAYKWSLCSVSCSWSCRRTLQLMHCPTGISQQCVHEASSHQPCQVASFPGLPHFCSLVHVQHSARIRRAEKKQNKKKTGKAWEHLLRKWHLVDARWTYVGGGECVPIYKLMCSKR